jgi:dipeptidyl aminopeptidase/acylaminoacyl peptidase
MKADLASSVMGVVLLLSAFRTTCEPAEKTSPDWVSSLALGIVRATLDSEVGAGDLKMRRAGAPLRSQPGRVLYVLSPDGTAALLRTAGKRQFEEILWLGRQGEGAATRFFEARWGMSDPRWSPTGDKVAFILQHMSEIDLTLVCSPKDDVRAYSLVVADIESGATKEVTPRWYYACTGFHPFDWSPGDGSIAFTASMVPFSDDRNTQELYVADVLSAIPSIVQLTHNDVSEEAPVFSPAGDRIAFRRSVFSLRFAQWVILDPARGEERIIAGGEFDEATRSRFSASGRVEWWPDGRGIRFWLRRPGGPPLRRVAYSYDLVTGASEIIETAD